METLTSIILAVLLATTFSLLVQHIRSEWELRRMAQFLDAHQNAEATQLVTKVRSGGFLALGKALNTQLEQHHKNDRLLQAQNQELRNGLAYLSHDIRTPLTGAKGYLQLFTEEQDPAEQVRYLSAVKERLDVLQATLDQLFLFTQISSSTAAIELQSVSLNQAIGHTLLSFYPQFEERHWTPRITLSEQEVTILADPHALERIFENLINNALKHGADCPCIKQTGASLVFSNRIADVQALDVEHIFDRFYQGEVSSRTHGSGLGLAIVKHLAEAMNALIEAECVGDRLQITLHFAQEPL